MGIKNLNGKDLIFRESQYAARNFKIAGGRTHEYKNNAIIPRPRFLFFAKFVISNSADRTAQTENNVKREVIFQIKQIDKPKFNIQTETMNQYNKKRVIQTSIEYNPMTINFHDDIGDKVLKFWADYFKYYYGDGGREQTTDWQNDIVQRNFFHGAQNGWGYRGNFTGGAANMHFFESIDLIQFYGQELTTVKFIRPIITEFDHDNSDYAEGREGTGIRMSFDYEGVIYELEGESAANHPEFNFIDDYFDPDAPDLSAFGGE